MQISGSGAPPARCWIAIVVISTAMLVTALPAVWTAFPQLVLVASPRERADQALERFLGDEREEGGAILLQRAAGCGSSAPTPRTA